jgi:hypothetical protein
MDSRPTVPLSLLRLRLTSPTSAARYPMGGSPISGPTRRCAEIFRRAAERWSPARPRRPIGAAQYLAPSRLHQWRAHSPDPYGRLDGSMCSASGVGGSVGLAAGSLVAPTASSMPPGEHHDRHPEADGVAVGGGARSEEAVAALASLALAAIAGGAAREDPEPLVVAGYTGGPPRLRLAFAARWRIDATTCWSASRSRAAQRRNRRRRRRPRPATRAEGGRCGRVTLPTHCRRTLA